MKKISFSSLRLLPPLTLLLLLVKPAWPEGSMAGPATVVEQFHQAIIKAMQLGSYEQRLAALTPVVASTFDTQTIARISLGSRWRRLAAEQQQGYADLMGNLITTTYAARFDNYSGQAFETRSEAPLPRNRVQVRTVLATGNDEVNLDYQLIRRDDGWRVYDVVANGVSDLSLKRASYSVLYDQGGLAMVEAEIRSNISQNEADKFSGD